MQLASSFPIRLAPTASYACPSCEEIDTLHRNAKHLIEEKFLTRVAYLNMSDPQQTCPNWNLITTSLVGGC